MKGDNVDNDNTLFLSSSWATGAITFKTTALNLVLPWENFDLKNLSELAVLQKSCQFWIASSYWQIVDLLYLSAGNIEPTAFLRGKLTCWVSERF